MDNGASAAGFGMGGFLLGVLAGAVVGGVVALLMAPKSGPETREMVVNRLSSMKNIVRSRVQEMGQKAEGMGQQT